MKTLINEIFNEINSDIFADMLDIPEFICVEDGEHFGWYCQIKKIDFVNINPKYMLTYNDIFGTIAHELIHVWQFTIMKKHWKKVGHRLDFVKKAKEISDFYKIPLDNIIEL